MKSFFKKLAFVMALAMVVALAAPAAAQAAPALVAAHQTSKEVVTELEMEVNEEIDLCFLGAGAGWRELNRGWKVTSGDAVTVNNDGLVKAVKNGDATIEFFMEGYESAVVTITVGEADTYEGYAQTYPDTVEFYIGGNLEKVAKSDVKLYRVFATAGGEEVTVSWPAKSVAGTKEGKLTLTTFTNFSDGGQYRITFNGTDYDFTTVLPTVEEITYVDTTYGTYDGNWWYNKDNGLAFVTEEDDENESVADFGYRVWYYYEGSLMNVTSLFDAEDLAIEYELVTPDADSEEAESINFDSEGTIVFADVIPVYVQVVASYETEEGDEVKLPTNGVEVVPTRRPALAVQEVLDWTFVKTSISKKADFSWALKTIPAGESQDYMIVLKLQDTRGQVYVTNQYAVPDNSGWLVLGDETPLDELGYTLRYYSTNEDDFLLGEYDGVIETYKKVDDAVFYVDLYQYDEDESEDKKVESIYAAEFDLGSPRYFNALYPAVKTVNVVADAIDGNSALLQKTVKITALDQYNDPFAPSYATWYLSCSDKDAEYGRDKDYWISNYGGDKNLEITVNGAKLYENTGSTSLTFTLTEKNAGISTSFKVNIGKPQWVDKTTEASKTNVAEGYFSSNKPEGKEEHSWNLIIDQFKENGVGHDSISFSVDRNDPFTWLGGGSDGVENKTYGGNTDYHREAIISLYKTSNKQVVGYHDLGSFLLINDEDWNDTTTGVILTANAGEHNVAVGDRIMMLVKDNEIVVPKYDLYHLNVEGGSVTIPLAAHYSNEVDRIDYANAGTYELIVYTVTEVETNSKNEVEFETEADTISFTVRNQLSKVTFGERTKIKSDYHFDGTEGDIEDLKKIVLDCFNFKLGGNAWGLTLNPDWTGEGIDSVDVINNVTYEISGNKVIIKTVEFNVPVDYSLALGAGEDYYRTSATKVTVNMSVEMAD